MSKRDKRQSAVKVRKIPIQRRSQEMCEVLILATARVLMNTQESQNWSTNQVAKEAGVSVGSLYQYYPNKEALVAALIEKYIENEIPLIRKKIDELKNEKNQAEAFKQVMLFLMGLYSKNKRLRKALVEYLPKVGLQSKMQEIETHVGDMIYEYILKKEAEQNVKNEKVKKFILAKSIIGVLRAAVLENSALLEEEILAQEFVDMFF